jgi:hypothetical protein
MKRFQGMLRQVGWLWGVIFLLNTALALVLSPLYLLMYPVLLVICIYFAYMRFDENGQPK